MWEMFLLQGALPLKKAINKRRGSLIRFDAPALGPNEIEASNTKLSLKNAQVRGRKGAPLRWQIKSSFGLKSSDYIIRLSFVSRAL